MKKTVSFILALLMAAGTLISCSESTENVDSNEKAQTQEAVSAVETTDTAEEETEESFEADSLPDDLKFTGTTVNVFGWSGPVQDEFYVEELNGEVVNDAIYTKNINVEDRLEIKLNYTLVPGAYDNRASWGNTIANSIQAGGGDFDISAGYSMAGATMAAKGYLIDLNQLDYIDFSKPWWPSSLQKEAVINGKLYFCSGDISTYMIYYMYAFYFNKQLVTDFSLESPYELVHENEWTLDKMISMTEGIYMDTNGNGEKDTGDTFGFITNSVYIDPFYFSSGLRVTSSDEEGNVVLSPDYSSEKAVDLVTTLVNWFATKDAFLTSNVNDPFAAGEVLFANHEFTMVTNTLRDSDLEYGIVPMPKYDTAQEDYYTVMSFPYSLYGVPIDVKNPDMSAAVLEALGSESYRTVSPALFEIAFKTKYAQDLETSEMFDLIRSSIVFDIGRIFNDSFGGATYSQFRSAVGNGNANWASTVKGQTKVLNKQFEKLFEKLK